MSIKAKIKKTIEKEGVWAIPVRAKNYLVFHTKQKITRLPNQNIFSDILFISGCNLPHPQRYRVEHQIEQLGARGISAEMVSYDKLDINKIKCYRGFVFYRCPITPTVKEFIKIAKKNNKTIFYDIDDLVFDTKYTDQIQYIQEMNKTERKLYDDGVTRMGQTMRLCEYGITTTKRLAREMGKTLQEVYINRNVASDDMVKYSQKALRNKKDQDKLTIGYFSGSMTHNGDFEMIMPVIKKLLEEYENLYLRVVGELEIPEALKSVEHKILMSPFVTWRELPELIHSVDINIAPLEHTIFNEAKSENKWTEAALVRVPTVASNWGAFREVIKNGQTGILCNNLQDWENALENLIKNQNLRTKVADSAYDEVMHNHTTLSTGGGIANFIQSKLRQNIAFVLPSTEISGGITVATTHAQILKKHGYDVFLINGHPTKKSDQNSDFGVFLAPVHDNLSNFSIDTMVATMWVTLEYVKTFQNCQTKKYLVQGFETNFYEYGQEDRLRANATYNQGDYVEYLTISEWCKNWLEKDFYQKVKIAHNGINLQDFKFEKRKFGNRKVKILIEGNSKDYYKNIDESFRITNKLDKNKFDISYLSYEGEPKSWYRIDHFYHKIPHDEVGKIYRKCDILLKTSTLESFSYPPLEMMATGGFVVAVSNSGNQEYLKDGENCLLYEQGNTSDALAKIHQIVEDGKLRDKLSKNGQATAKNRSWDKLEAEILKLYK